MDAAGIEAVVRGDAALLEDDPAGFLGSLTAAPVRVRSGAAASAYEAALRRCLYEPVADAVGSKVGQEALPPAAGAPGSGGPPAASFDGVLGLPQLPGLSRRGGRDASSADLAAVRRAAVAVRVLLKAAVALDDIQDGSGVRYGEAALHVTHGIPLALNAGSWLITAALEHAGDPTVVAGLVRAVGHGLAGRGLGNRVFLELRGRCARRVGRPGAETIRPGRPRLQETLPGLAAQAVELKRAAKDAVHGVCRSERGAAYFDVTIERKGHLIDGRYRRVGQRSGACVPGDASPA
ncbi:hypothetical protein ACGFZK_20835 [Streptomyces sp. NPDC048257]|uniref:hypothetical protein n=1 Tax=Streptomyces sp. NPDC048257 TaxID=3365526 RepID=UPI00371D2946